MQILKGLRVVLAEPNLALRKEFIAILQDLGCTDITDTGNLADVYKAFEHGGIDLLIGDTTLPEGELSQAVHDIRHGVIGDNPFIIAMILVSESDAGKVEDVINSGADDIQIKPIKDNVLQNRLLALANGRKRFVVTTDYIGPDRRPKGAFVPNTIEVPLIKVPNPLRVRISGRLGNLSAQREINSAMTVVNEQKIERHAYSVNWLMQQIGKMQSGELPVDALDMKDQFDRLHNISEDIVSRLNGTTYSHAADLCLTLENMSVALKNAPELAGEEELYLLGRLTEVIKRKCNGEYIDSYYSGEGMAMPDDGQPVSADTAETTSPVIN